MKDSKTNLYFPNLNGLRFLGALLVLISHIEYLKKCFGLPNLFGDHRFAMLGKLGVHLFFVLSGFLLTSLLLQEQKTSNKININRFYLRRIIKIWPLYFLIIFFGFFLLPNLNLFEIPTLTEQFNENFWSKLFYNIFFMPNLAMVLYSVTPLSFQLWSIGLEEQYYLFIPWIVAKAKSRIKLFILIILSYLLLKENIAVIYSENPQSTTWDNLHYFWYYFHIDSLSLGSLSALLNEKYPDFIKKVFLNRFVEILSLILLIFFYYQLSKRDFYYQDEVYDLFLSIIILNAALNKKTIIKLENKLINYLGKISYSTYMVHVIVLAFSFNLLKNFNILSNFNIYLLSIFLTYLFSMFIYEFFEAKILTLKNKF